MMEWIIAGIGVVCLLAAAIMFIGGTPPDEW